MVLTTLFLLTLNHPLLCWFWPLLCSLLHLFWSRITLLCRIRCVPTLIYFSLAFFFVMVLTTLLYWFWTTLCCAGTDHSLLYWLWTTLCCAGTEPLSLFDSKPLLCLNHHTNRLLAWPPVWFGFESLICYHLFCTGPESLCCATSDAILVVLLQIFFV